MKGIEDLVNILYGNPACIVTPASKQPIIPESLKLPNDLKLFYDRCGGVIFFPDKAFSIEIVSPTDFVRANPVIVGESCDYDISYHWFIVGRAGEQYFTIDLTEKRLGWCYDSFWDRHGVPGDNPIIAKSFTQLLEFIYINNGEYWYWLREGFSSFGDAYDELV